MVDCRLCKHCYKIWADELYGMDYKDGNYKIVCLTKEIFIDTEYIPSGQCEEYVDVDGYDTE